MTDREGLKWGRLRRLGRTLGGTVLAILLAMAGASTLRADAVVLDTVTYSSAVRTATALHASVTVRSGPRHRVPGCSSSDCRYIVTVTRHFSHAVRCRATSSMGSGGFIEWKQGGSATRRGPNVFGQPGGWVEVTCNGVSSGHYTWP